MPSNGVIPVLPTVVVAGDVESDSYDKLWQSGMEEALFGYDRLPERHKEVNE